MASLFIPLPLPAWKSYILTMGLRWPSNACRLLTTHHKSPLGACFIIHSICPTKGARCAFTPGSPPGGYWVGHWVWLCDAFVGMSDVDYKIRSGHELREVWTWF